VHDQKISVVRAVSLEEDRRAHEKTQQPEAPAATARPKKTFGVIFIAGVLLVLGIGALWGVYIAMRPATPAAQTPLTTSSILFAEQSESLSLAGISPDDLKRTLGGARTALQSTLGSITEIVPTEPALDGEAGATRRATFSEFIAAIGAHPPESLLRALGNSFFFGIHTVDTNAPLLIVPVTSYDRAFAGMLAWEGTMNVDLAPIFTPLPGMTTDQNGLPVARTFQDTVMRNYDVRILRDDAGQIRLYYSFPTQHVLIIAESPYSFAEILSRLQAGRQL